MERCLCLLESQLVLLTNFLFQKHFGVESSFSASRGFHILPENYGLVFSHSKNCKMKFLINNAIEALIPFRKEHQGLLKLYESLVGAVSIVGLSPKERIYFEAKNQYEEAFQNFLKFYLFFGGSLESSNAEKQGDNRKKRFYGEMWENIF